MRRSSWLALALAAGGCAAEPGDGRGSCAPFEGTRATGAGSLLASYFNNVGISDDCDPGTADFDGDGFSYSLQALAEVGVPPGAALDVDGLELAWPAAAPGQPDNVIADGQAIAVGASSGATTLAVLASASNAGVNGAWGLMTIDYADGTSQSVPLVVSDWTLDGGSVTPVVGNVPLVSTRYRDPDDQSRPDVFLIAIPLSSSQPVTRIELPRGSLGGELHVFDLTLAASSP